MPQTTDIVEWAHHGRADKAPSTLRMPQGPSLQEQGATALKQMNDSLPAGMQAPFKVDPAARTQYSPRTNEITLGENMGQGSGQYLKTGQDLSPAAVSNHELQHYLAANTRGAGGSMAATSRITDVVPAGLPGAGKELGYAAEEGQANARAALAPGQSMSDRLGLMDLSNQQFALARRTAKEVEGTDIGAALKPEGEIYTWTEGAHGQWPQPNGGARPEELDGILQWMDKQKAKREATGTPPTDTPIPTQTPTS